MIISKVSIKARKIRRSYRCPKSALARGTFRPRGRIREKYYIQNITPSYRIMDKGPRKVKEHAEKPVTVTKAAPSNLGIKTAV